MIIARITAGDLAAWATVATAASIIAAKSGAVARRAWKAYKERSAEDQLVRDTVKAVAPLHLDKVIPKIQADVSKIDGLTKRVSRRLTDHIRKGHA